MLDHPNARKNILVCLKKFVRLKYLNFYKSECIPLQYIICNKVSITTSCKSRLVQKLFSFACYKSRGVTFSLVKDTFLFVSFPHFYVRNKQA